MVPAEKDKAFITSVNFVILVRKYYFAWRQNSKLGQGIK